jgi:hypothetical protein
MRFAAAVVALALVLPHGGGRERQQGQPPRDARVNANASGRIAGVVTTDEPQPRPLRRARVALTGSALDMGRSVVTGDDGSFVFERVPPGRFTVGAEKPGYVAMNYGAARPGRSGLGVQVADRQTVQIAMRLPRGAAITGTVLDIDGQPAAGVSVAVMTRRYLNSEGDYRYMAIASPGPTTDDRGVYRVFGLAAGDYYVAAQPPTGRGNSVVTPAVFRPMSSGMPADRLVALAQVFHPDTTDVSRATRLTVKAGEERTGVDIQLEYVPLATISGLAPVPDGWSAATVTLARLDDPTGYPLGHVARADADGRFSLASIPPGIYRLFARSAAGGPQPSGRGVDPSSGPVAALFASADVAIAGDDLSNINLSLQPALTISGRIVFEGTRPAPPLADMSVNVPLALRSADSGYGLPRVQIQPGGTFRLEGVMPGRYRGFNTMRGIAEPIANWWVKSLSSGGREQLDAPIELHDSLAGLTLTLADDASELSGAVVDERGAAAPEAYVVAFSADRAMWFQNSRRVVAVHRDRAGRYTIRNLPPGDYRITVADLDQGEWFDPDVLERLLSSATPLTIAGFEKKTLDLTWR